MLGFVRSDRPLLWRPKIHGPTCYTVNCDHTRGPIEAPARKRGSPIAAQTIAAARAARSSQAAKASASTRAAIEEIRRGGISTLGAIGKALEVRGIRTPAGGSTWQRAQVARVMAAGMVRVVITCDHVYLPLDVDGNVITDWQQDCPGPVNADGKSPRPDPSKVVRKTKLLMPAELAASLASRGQAEIL
jgi:hypothetical protein